MKKRSNKYLLKSILIANLNLLLVLNNSCSKLVTVESPSNVIAANDMFSSMLGYESALAGIYTQLQTYQSIGGGGLSSYMSLASDELVPSTTSAVFQGFYANTILSSNSVVNTFWFNAYRTIYRCNLILENLDKSTFLSENVKNEFLMRAVFIRCFCYFHLLQLFGDVPLVLGSDYRLNATMKRTPVEDVLEHVISELSATLPYASKVFNKNRDQPNFYALSVLLAKSYMLSGQYQKARALCLDIYAEGDLYLENDLNKVFLKESKETIFQLSSTVSVAPEANLFIPFSDVSKALFTFNNSFLQVFESNDMRKLSWIRSQDIGGVTYYYPFKYRNLQTIPSTEFGVVFRLADVYLMDLECSLELKDYERAVKFLNKIRRRAGLASLSGLSDKQIGDELKKQRQLEFFTEWGIRWFDLKRWGIIDDVLGEIKPTWKSTSQLIPIPATELKSNVNLIQNEGYDD